METVKITINGKEYDVPKGSTILEAARSVGIVIPTLCYMKKINAIGACRVCVVEVKGARSLVASCVYPVSEGMVLDTASERVIHARKMTLELILSNHNRNCLTCNRNQNCELQTLSKVYGLDDVRFNAPMAPRHVDDSNNIIIRDNSKCILCRRCVAACGTNQAVSVIGANERGFNTTIGCAFEKPLSEVPCVTCGQCIVSCPTGALHEKDETQTVVKALNDPNKHVVIGIAPSVRVQLGEYYNFPIGTNVEGKIATALRAIGFDGVFDVNTAADLTIMEEGTELLKRVQENGPFPLITSCSPGWINYAERFFPDMIPNISSCKSPQGMFGSMMKSYYADTTGRKAEDIYVVSVMPCVAKKYEAARPEMTVRGQRVIDVSLTVRELSKLIDRYGIAFAELPETEFDPAFGAQTGAAQIFGVTGGVMEAALRTVAEIMENKPLEKLEFDDVRGFEGVKEASYTLQGIDVKVAIASGLANAKRLLTAISKGEKFYHFVEIMACPGGCVNGGGQPIQPSSITNFTNVPALRAAGLYNTDEHMALRKSHDNPVIQHIYKTYLDEPGSHKAHELLHTHYSPKGQY